MHSTRDFSSCKQSFNTGKIVIIFFLFFNFSLIFLTLGIGGFSQGICCFGLNFGLFVDAQTPHRIVNGRRYKPEIELFIKVEVFDWKNHFSVGIRGFLLIFHFFLLFIFLRFVVLFLLIGLFLCKGVILLQSGPKVLRREAEHLGELISVFGSLDKAFLQVERKCLTELGCGLFVKHDENCVIVVVGIGGCNLRINIIFCYFLA